LFGSSELLEVVEDITLVAFAMGSPTVPFTAKVRALTNVVGMVGIPAMAHIMASSAATMQLDKLALVDTFDQATIVVVSKLLALLEQMLVVVVAVGRQPKVLARVDVSATMLANMTPMVAAIISMDTQRPQLARRLSLLFPLAKLPRPLLREEVFLSLVLQVIL